MYGGNRASVSVSICRAITFRGSSGCARKQRNGTHAWLCAKECDVKRHLSHRSVRAVRWSGWTLRSFKAWKVRSVHIRKNGESVLTNIFQNERYAGDEPAY